MIIKGYGYIGKVKVDQNITGYSLVNNRKYLRSNVKANMEYEH